MIDPKLRISEVYLSIQGEGPRVGSPTVFVRSAGCNLRCPGWACDTPHAIDPTIYTKDAKLLTALQVSGQVEMAAPHGANICLTGGEPFLQNSAALERLCSMLGDSGYSTQEVFTNGTIEFPDWAFEQLFFIMDWKLTGSGEIKNLYGSPSLNRARWKNFEKLNPGDVVKFTIADQHDYEEAKTTYEDLKTRSDYVGFIYGVVWGKLEASELIKWVLDDGLVDWTYSHQLHNVIWDRTKRGI